MRKLIFLTVCLMVLPVVVAQAMDFDDSLMGTVESISAFSPPGSRGVQYFVVSLKEYKNSYFQVPKTVAITSGLYDQHSPDGFNREKLDNLEGRQVEVRSRRMKSPNPGDDWFMVTKLRFLNR